jgi:transposase
MKRKKYTSKFKTKVVLEALKERHSLAEFAKKYQIHPTQMSSWNRAFLNGAKQVFESGKKDIHSEAEKKNDQLLKTIGEFKVEVAFLKDTLR